MAVIGIVMLLDPSIDCAVAVTPDSVMVMVLAHLVAVAAFPVVEALPTYSFVTISLLSEILPR